MSNLSRHVLTELARELATIFGDELGDQFGQRLSMRPLAEQFQAPSLSTILTSISLTLENVEQTSRPPVVAWNPVIACYHKALTRLLTPGTKVKTTPPVAKAPPAYKEPVHAHPQTYSDVTQRQSTHSSSSADSPVAAKFKGLSLGQQNRTKDPSSTPVQRKVVSAPHQTEATTCVPKKTTTPPPGARNQLQEIWESPREPLYSNCIWSKCELPLCQFCRGLFKDSSITKCHDYPKGHKVVDGTMQTCSSSGWYPHVGVRLWKTLRGPHARGENYQFSEMVRENSLRSLPQTSPTPSPIKRKLEKGDSSSIPSRRRTTSPFEEGEISDCTLIDDESLDSLSWEDEVSQLPADDYTSYGARDKSHAPAF